MSEGRSLRAELERKRVLLAQIREDRERRARITQENHENSENPINDADSILHALGINYLSRSSTAPSNISSTDNQPIASPEPVVTSETQPHQVQCTSLDDSFVMRQVVPLQLVHVNQINIAPEERVYYTKSTQTPAPEAPPQVESETPTGDIAGINVALEWEDEFSGIISAASALPELRDMKEAERLQVELMEDYQQFIDRASRVLERAIYQNESPDIFIQYFPDEGKEAINNDKKSGSKLSFNRIFHDDKWSRNRCVTGFDWSAQYPELLLASYNKNEQAPSEPDGTLLVWNMKFKNTTPEYIFHCQSPIMSCCFAKFHPSLIVGGTYSGQIVLWDMRSNKKTPVQRSPLTATAHTHPVYCAEVIGSQNAHNLISISTDGRLCSWSLDMLSAPQETMELNQQKQSRSVAVTSMSFHPVDYNNFLVGSEEGVVYSACRHGSKSGILSSFDSHQGLITSVDYRPVDTGHSRLFLTSSIDWTVKLWDSKESEPIHSFESNGDYVYDVKWSPTNPALFATTDGDGRVDIWNLANDSELPTASICIGQSLNKLIWTPSGEQVVVGDDIGRIHVYDIGDICGSSKRQEENWKIKDHI